MEGTLSKMLFFVCVLGEGNPLGPQVQFLSEFKISSAWLFKIETKMFFWEEGEDLDYLLMLNFENGLLYPFKINKR